MALPSTLAPLFQTATDDQSLLQRVVGFVEYCKKAALAALDPFQVSFSEVCRQHRITPVQMMQRGGSHRLIANRRAVLVDLLAEGWPDETLMSVVPVSKTELKRLHKLARAKGGPKLGLSLN